MPLSPALPRPLPTPFFANSLSFHFTAKESLGWKYISSQTYLESSPHRHPPSYLVSGRDLSPSPSSVSQLLSLLVFTGSLRSIHIHVQVSPPYKSSLNPVSSLTLQDFLSFPNLSLSSLLSSSVCYAPPSHPHYPSELLSRWKSTFPCQTTHRFLSLPHLASGQLLNLFGLPSLKLSSSHFSDCCLFFLPSVLSLGSFLIPHPLMASTTIYLRCLPNHTEPDLLHELGCSPMLTQSFKSWPTQNSPLPHPCHFYITFCNFPHIL